MLIQTAVYKDGDTILNPSSEDHYYKRTFINKKERDMAYETLISDWSMALRKQAR